MIKKIKIRRRRISRINRIDKNQTDTPTKQPTLPPHIINQIQKINPNVVRF
jgi:hypothetical protein